MSDDLVREWFESYGAKLVSYLVNQCGCTPEEAEDIVHDLFALLLRKLGEGMPPPEKVESYLYRAVTNRRINETRTKQFKQKTSWDLLVQGGEQIPAPGKNPAQIALDKEMIEALGACFEKLPKRQREVLLLSDVNGLSGVEIRELLGISEGELFGLQHRGRTSLRRCLRDKDFDGYWTSSENV